MNCQLTTTRWAKHFWSLHVGYELPVDNNPVSKTFLITACRIWTASWQQPGGQNSSRPTAQGIQICECDCKLFACAQKPCWPHHYLDQISFPETTAQKPNTGRLVDNKKKIKKPTATFAWDERGFVNVGYALREVTGEMTGAIKYSVAGLVGAVWPRRRLWV